MLYPARSILMIDAAPFGQALLLLPVARVVRAAYPKTLIVAAAPTGVCELLTASGLVEEAIDLGIVSPPGGGRGGAFKRLARLMTRSRRDTFDLVLDLSPRLETQVMSRLSLRGRTVSPSKLPNIIDSLLGRAGMGRGDNNHAGDCLSVLRQIGIKLDELRLDVMPPSEENVRFEQLLARQGSRGGEPLVLLYASEAAGSRGWAVDGFGELAVRLGNNFMARIIVADQPATREFTNAVGSLLPRGAIKLQAPRSLELTAAVARASIVVTDDAGLARLAADLRTPVLEIAESSSPLLSKRHRVIQSPSLARVSVEEVYEIACQMLQESRSESLFHR